MVLPLIPILGFATTLIERLIPDKQAQAKAKLELIKLEQEGELSKIQGQLQINMKEAQSSSIFVAGWRPFVGWTCGSAFAYNFVLQPFLIFGFTMSGYPVPILPSLDMGILLAVLGGMLGIGSMRSFDKLKGTDTKNVSK